jgi:hypothetical protein
MATSRVESDSWTSSPQLLAINSAGDDNDLKAPANELGNTDRYHHDRGYFKGAQWYDSLHHTIQPRYIHSWLAGLLMAHLSSPIRPIIASEPS